MSTNGQYDIKKRIWQILQMKAKIEEIKERHAAELAGWMTDYERLRADVREYLSVSGQDSAKTEAGTATLVMNTYYRVEDQGAFREYAIANQDWGCVYWGKVIAEGVKAYQVKNGVKIGPPGVKITPELTVRINSPTKPKTEGEKTPVKPSEGAPLVDVL